MDTQLTEQAKLWQRIHAALDRHEDPLADPDLALALGEHPELASQVVQLLENLESLPPAPRAVPGAWPLRRRVVAGLVTAAALVLLAPGVWRSLQPKSNDSPMPNSEVALPLLALRIGPPQFHVVLEHTGPAGKRRISITDKSRTSEFEPSPAHQWAPDEAGRENACRVSLGDRLAYERVIALSTNE